MEALPALKCAAGKSVSFFTKIERMEALPALKCAAGKMLPALKKLSGLKHCPLYLPA